MPASASHSRLRVVSLIALTALWCLFVLLLIESLSWRLEHDTPLLHYAAFLMDRYGLIPYRDIFETSMPGTFAFHYAIGTTLGYGDTAFRTVDLLLLGALLAATAVFMSRFGRTTAAWAVALFGIAYLAQGQEMSLQRDYLGVLPVAFALLLIPRETPSHLPLLRFLGLGLLFGVAMTIKPHLAIALPVMYLALLASAWPRLDNALPSIIASGLICGAGLIAPPLLAIIWLAVNGGLAAFTDMVFHYLPLHLSISGRHEVLSGTQRLTYLARGMLHLGGYGLLLFGAIVAYVRLTWLPSQGWPRLAAVCLAGCTVAYAIYPVFGGKFWPYHFMPFVYFACLSLALTLSRWPSLPTTRPAARYVELAALLLIVAVFSQSFNVPHVALQAVENYRAGASAHAPRNGQVDELAEWLREQVIEDDTVQPLDWTAGGAIQAMLIAETRLATRFMYGYHFYHHVNEPEIQQLRREFITQLEMARPRYILDMRTSRSWVWGENTASEFAPLTDYMATHYTQVKATDAYRIYARRDP